MFGRRSGGAHVLQEADPVGRNGEPNHQPGTEVLGAALSAPLAAIDRQQLLPGADELFRTIYTRARVGAFETLAVCSSIAGEGKTSVSVGLAVTLAEDFPDRRVVVVETDLDRPVMARDFGMAPNPGLVDCLTGDQPIQVACHTTLLDNLHVVLAGEPVRSPGRLLRSSRMAAAVDAIRQSYSIVILDVPPILVNSDASLVADLADGILLVVRAGVTPISLVHKAIEQLDESRLRGVVLNGTESAVPGWLHRLCGL